MVESETGLLEEPEHVEDPEKEFEEEFESKRALELRPEPMLEIKQEPEQEPVPERISIIEEVLVTVLERTLECIEVLGDSLSQDVAEIGEIEAAAAPVEAVEHQHLADDLTMTPSTSTPEVVSHLITPMTTSQQLSTINDEFPTLDGDFKVSSSSAPFWLPDEDELCAGRDSNAGRFSSKRSLSILPEEIEFEQEDSYETLSNRYDNLTFAVSRKSEPDVLNGVQEIPTHSGNEAPDFVQPLEDAAVSDAVPEMKEEHQEQPVVDHSTEEIRSEEVQVHMDTIRDLDLPLAHSMAKPVEPSSNQVLNFTEMSRRDYLLLSTGFCENSSLTFKPDLEPVRTGSEEPELEPDQVQDQLDDLEAKQDITDLDER